MKFGQRIPTLVFFLAAVVLTAGCGGAGTGVPATSAASSPGSAAPAVEVDEGLLSVDIKIRRSLLDPGGEQTDAQIIQAAKDKGMAAVVNGDDTVTYTMSRAQQTELLNGMRTSLSESNADLIEKQDNSFTGIDVSDDMSSFTVKVDKKKYTEFEALYALGFYIQGGLFQQFSGVDAEKMDVTVRFVDDATGEVLNSGSLQEWMDRQSE